MPRVARSGRLVNAPHVRTQTSEISPSYTNFFLSTSHRSVDPTASHRRLEGCRTLLAVEVKTFYLLLTLSFEIQPTAKAAPIQSFTLVRGAWGVY